MLVHLITAAALAQSPPAPAPAGPASAAPQVEAESAGARALFEANVRAIQDKDREAYLACYRADERLVRTGPDGVSTGFEALAAGTAATGSDDWPERLIAEQLQVHWLAPGVVYGAYRYTVTFAGETTTGLSERVLLQGDDGVWHIGVSTAFPTPAPEP